MTYYYQTQMHCQFHYKCMGIFKYIVNFEWAKSKFNTLSTLLQMHGQPLKHGQNMA